MTHAHRLQFIDAEAGPETDLVTTGTNVLSYTLSHVTSGCLHIYSSRIHFNKIQNAFSDDEFCTFSFTMKQALYELKGETKKSVHQ